MKESCVINPPNEPLIIIRQWQKDFCNGDTCAAALLSFFIYWHDIKLEIQKKNHTVNEIAKIHGDDLDLDTTLLQFHNTEELEKGIMGIAKKKKIRESLKILIKLKVLSIHQNPNPRYKFDHTYFYLLHPECFSSFLLERTTQTLAGVDKAKRAEQKGEKGLSRGEKGLSRGEKGLTRTETTSKVPSETLKNKQKDLSSQKLPKKKSTITGPQATVLRNFYKYTSKKNANYYRNKNYQTETKTTKWINNGEKLFKLISPEQVQKIINYLENTETGWVVLDTLQLIKKCGKILDAIERDKKHSNQPKKGPRHGIQSNDPEGYIRESDPVL